MYFPYILALIFSGFYALSKFKNLKFLQFAETLFELHGHQPLAVNSQLEDHPAPGPLSGQPVRRNLLIFFKFRPNSQTSVGLTGNTGDSNFNTETNQGKPL